MIGVQVSSIVNEVIRTILRLLFFFLRKHFKRTKTQIKPKKTQQKNKRTKNNKSNNFLCSKTSSRRKIVYFAFFFKYWSCSSSFIYSPTFKFSFWQNVIMFKSGKPIFAKAEVYSKSEKRSKLSANAFSFSLGMVFLQPEHASRMLLFPLSIKSKKSELGFSFLSRMKFHNICVVA